MCGISGFNFYQPDLLGRMNRVQAHRGPDDEGSFFDDWVSLGNRRLAVIDLSEGGHQPMVSADSSLVITYNGEIYNFLELRAELEEEGFHFRSASDTEVLLAAYQRYGRSCLQRLNGMFAFALYDRRQRRLLLARDRVGEKPLYYYWDGTKLIFASELKAILEHPVPREPNRAALEQFFTYRFNFGAETLVQKIFKLPPGHFLYFDLEKARIEESGAWWELPALEQRAEDGVSAVAEELERLLYDAVEKRLIADVPIGFFLSGGLDSSIITAIAARLGAKLKTFSAGFETTNELAYARLAARHFGSDHHEVFIGPEALELLETMVYHMDEPIGDAAFLATFILSREARREVKVVLAGEGADELFAGYDRYKLALYGNALSLLIPAVLKSYIARLRPRSENLRRVARVLAGRDRAARYLEVIRLFSAQELGELALSAEPANGFGLLAGDLLRAVQYFDFKTLLPNDFCMKADKMSSACGLEERVPYLDHRVVELAFRLPRPLKLRGRQEKRILRRAFADLVPPAIRQRRKHGFDVPMDHWLRGPLRDRLRRLLEEDAHDLYRKQPVLEMLEAFSLAGGSYRRNFFAAQKLWSVLVFELWYRRFLG